jgi:hypothetical protein
MGEEYPPAAGLSRQMQLAVRFYDQGKDSEALDRFMGILMHGDPTERSMANEYINLISQRMGNVGRVMPDKAAGEPPEILGMGPVPRRPRPPPKAEPGASPAELPAGAARAPAKAPPPPRAPPGPRWRKSVLGAEL